MDDTTALRRTARADICAGGAFVAFGGAFAIGSAVQYERGTALQMGPGYVPLVLGAILALLGAAIVVQGVLASRTGGTASPDHVVPGDEPGSVPWRRGVLLVGAVLVFALTVDGLGLGVSLFVTAFLAALAGHRNTPVKALLIAAGLTLLCLVVFVAVLQLRLPVLGEWVGG